MQTENNPDSAMLKELSQAREEARATARGGSTEQAEELPEGTSPLEAREETSVGEDEASEEASEGGTEGGETEVAEPEDEGPIRIGGQTFKTQAEAIKYAEGLEREKELTDAHSAGIREALEATRVPAKQEPEPEDNFDERFYANPKEALAEVQKKATSDALLIIRQETQREKLWNDFLGEYPDIRRKDAQRILDENWDTIGKITDLGKAQKILANRVRAEYDEIRQLGKPRTELSSKKQTQSPGGGRSPGVTQKKNEDRPLSFAEQMRKLKK
jgi:hypothetical protein